jgi:hypothetical protein
MRWLDVRGGSAAFLHQHLHRQQKQQQQQQQQSCWEVLPKSRGMKHRCR